MNAESTLAVEFQRIFAHFRHQNEIKQSLKKVSSQSRTALAKKEKRLVDELREEEIEFLNSIIRMADVAEAHFTSAGMSIKPVKMIRAFRPFQIARSIVAEGSKKPAKYQAYLREIVSDEQQGAIADVISAEIYEGRIISHPSLALDLLQYWELVLRHQTKIQDKEFCPALKKALAIRIEIVMNHISILQRLPDTEQSGLTSSSPSIEAVEKDISDRLDRILLHLQQIDILKTTFYGRLEDDFLHPLRRQRDLFSEEISIVLHELVHLSDNIQKWLISNRLDTQELNAIHNFTFYHAASCFVNTRKHGVRGRNKESALADYEIVFKDGDKVIDTDLIINYKGEDWQATTLIDDLLQAWELFIRYYTSIDLSEFHHEISKRFASRKMLSTYSAEVGEKCANDLVEKYTERQRYNI